ncbi:tyrosine-type recombinase/integrase [Kutzneria viridogrisea]|uniref:Integrase n=1 Tax=Kutzneria viridogrisea TaxID=47990 RepID=A0ABR6BJK2_9PSEU|nr:integrase [Kutzneria viridogrisea]
MTSIAADDDRLPLQTQTDGALDGHSVGEGAAYVQMLRRRFPPRPAETSWVQTTWSREEILDLLASPAFRTPNRITQRARLLGTRRLLDWLAIHPGDTWQQRWLASGQDGLSGSDWALLPADWLAAQGDDGAANLGVLASGMRMLVCAEVIRPTAAWVITRRSSHLTAGMAQYRDPAGFAALDQLIAADPAVSRDNANLAKSRVSFILAAKGGRIADVAVGDCVELYDLDTSPGTQRVKRYGRTLYYTLLHRMGVFSADAPSTLDELFCGRRRGQLSVRELVDRHNLQCTPIRDLIVDYLTERRPAIDYATLTNHAHMLAGLFWSDLERHHPGIASLHLPPEVATAWKTRLRTDTREAGGPTADTSKAIGRHKVGRVLLAVRAFYLDIAQWALEEPARWGPWAAPCPIKAVEARAKKEQQATKARMDQRTRERLPVLPVLQRTAAERQKSMAALLEAAGNTPPGQTFELDGDVFSRPAPGADKQHALVWAEHATTGLRRNLTREERDAFWAWAAIEVLSRTGIRIEELLELSHQAITSYRLPSTGELVPLLQIVPSKTDSERLLLVDPELTDVLSTIVCRIRKPDGTVPLVPAYDSYELTWTPPMGLLFQRNVAGQNRAFTAAGIREVIKQTLEATGLTEAAGDPLHFTPHDFRRIFVTDAIINGLPPHIAQVICGHKKIDTTMGYKATYPTEAIEAHRAFIARRRAARPSEEYRTPTDEEWDAFLAQFEKRKVSVGTCARAFNTPCIHEHACVRCSLLRPDPAQRHRLVEIRDNLEARIIEAKREGWLGEVEGLQVSLAGAKNKIAQLDQKLARRAEAVELGMPQFTDLAGRSITTARA